MEFGTRNAMAPEFSGIGLAPEFCCDQLSSKELLFSESRIRILLERPSPSYGKVIDILEKLVKSRQTLSKAMMARNGFRLSIHLMVDLLESKKKSPLYIQ
ncbi:hypothetical protein Tco_0919866 [Tanacetum coccineum]